MPRRDKRARMAQRERLAPEPDGSGAGLDKPMTPWALCHLAYFGRARPIRARHPGAGRGGVQDQAMARRRGPGTDERNREVRAPRSADSETDAST